MIDHIFKYNNILQNELYNNIMNDINKYIISQLN